MIKKVNILFVLVILNSFIGNSQTPVVFDWESATVNPDGSISQTVDGLTVTVSVLTEKMNTIGISNEVSGASSNNIITGMVNVSDQIRFSFDNAVNIVSIKEGIGSGDPTHFCYSSNKISFENLCGLGDVTPTVFTDIKTNVLRSDHLSNIKVFTSESLIGTFDQQIHYVFDDLIVTPVTTLSTTDQKLVGVKVFPNPVQDILYLGNIENIKSVKLYDNLERLVSQSKTNEVEMHKFPKGLYHVRVETDNGKEETKSILKK